MSETKWTPGPWSVTGQPNKVCVNGYTKNGSAKTVTTTNEASWLGNVEPYANAQLISAAPDLYEALDVFIEMYVRMVNSGDCGNWDPEKETEVIASRAALAKARGEA